MNASVPGLLLISLFEDFLITVSISVLVIGLYIFSFLPSSILEDCVFVRICPFFPGCPFYRNIITYNRLSRSLYFCGVSFHFYFHFNFIDLRLLFFFLMSLNNSLSILFISLKNQLLVLIIFAIFFQQFFFHLFLLCS